MQSLMGGTPFGGLGALSVMANAPRVTYGQGIARHHGSHLCIAFLL